MRLEDGWRSAARLTNSKAHYAPGESFLEVPGGLVHIVGNDSSTDAVTFHVYRPELVMELFSDSEADLAALHGTTI